MRFGLACFLIELRCECCGIDAHFARYWTILYLAKSRATFISLAGIMMIGLGALGGVIGMLLLFPYGIISRHIIATHPLCGDVFITTDPARDTPDVIRSYLDQFSRDFVGLTGTEEELVAAQKALGSIVAVRESDDENYTMGHDGRVFAFAPDGWGYTQYPHPTRQSSWDHDLPLLAAMVEGAA